MVKAILSFAFAALIGQEAHATVLSYADAVTVDGDTIRVSAAGARHIQGEGLAEILMQAAATPVIRGGVQIGYRMTDFDAGSVFQTIGLQERDIVLEIDGMALTDPRHAVEILRYARTLDAFDVRIVRAKQYRTLRVVIGTDKEAAGLANPRKNT